jgi:hypothetical protein
MYHNFRYRRRTGDRPEAPTLNGEAPEASTALLNGRDRARARAYLNGLTSKLGHELSHTEDATTAGYTSAPDPIQQLVRRPRAGP